MTSPKLSLPFLLYRKHPKTKRIRKANWTDDDMLHLLALIKERKIIIKGSLSPALTARMKHQARDEIVT